MVATSKAKHYTSPAASGVNHSYAPDQECPKLGEPALDEVEPARTGRDKVQHKARALPQTRADAFVAVERLVVQGQMEATRRRKLHLDATKKTQELLMPMTRATLRHDIVLTDVQRGKQAGRAVTLTLVGNPTHYIDA